MCVCILVCVCVCVYLWAYMYVCVFVYLCLCAWRYACKYVHAWVWVSICMYYMCMHIVCAHVRVCECMIVKLISIQWFNSYYCMQFSNTVNAPKKRMHAKHDSLTSAVTMPWSAEKCLAKHLSLWQAHTCLIINRDLCCRKLLSHESFAMWQCTCWEFQETKFVFMLNGCVGSKINQRPHYTDVHGQVLLNQMTCTIDTIIIYQSSQAIFLSNSFQLKYGIISKLDVPRIY